MTSAASQAAREPAIALVFSPEPWVEDLHRHLSDHGGARVRQIVLEPSVALEEEYDTLVVSHRWPALGKPLVESVHDRGRWVLGVFGADEPGGRDFLRGLGVDAVIAAECAPADFVSALVSLGLNSGAALRPAPEVASRLVPGPHSRTGVGTIAVAGPAGAGSTEVAIQVARACAAAGRETVLVDADQSRASIAVRLGLPIDPNLRTALDAVEYGDGNLESSLVLIGATPLHVLCGLPSADAGAHVHGREVVDVVHMLGTTHAHVVNNVAGVVSEGIAAAIVSEAGTVVGVGTGTPVGIARLLAWIADLRSVSPSVALHLVINFAPRDRFRRAEIATEIAHTIEPASLVFAPFDRRVEPATWNGTLLGRGPFTKALAPLSQALSPGPTPRRVSERRQARRRALALAEGSG